MLAPGGKLQDTQFLKLWRTDMRSPLSLNLNIAWQYENRKDKNIKPITSNNFQFLYFCEKKMHQYNLRQAFYSNVLSIAYDGIRMMGSYCALIVQWTCKKKHVSLVWFFLIFAVSLILHPSLTYCNNLETLGLLICLPIVSFILIYAKTYLYSLERWISKYEKRETLFQNECNNNITNGRLNK